MQCRSSTTYGNARTGKAQMDRVPSFLLPTFVGVSTGPDFTQALGSVLKSSNKSNVASPLGDTLLGEP